MKKLISDSWKWDVTEEDKASWTAFGLQQDPLPASRPRGKFEPFDKSAYELEREKNIDNNKIKLTELGLDKDVLASAPAPIPPAPPPIKGGVGGFAASNLFTTHELLDFEEAVTGRMIA